MHNPTCPVRVRAALAGVAVAAIATAAESADSRRDADLILFNGKVWTVDARQPVAQAVAVRGTQIARVGTDAEVLALRGAATRTVDLRGQLVLPGFNDAHTHFENAVDWFFQVLLMDVADQAELLRRLRETVARVPPGRWITGGDWSAFAFWAAQKKGETGFASFKPDLATVDVIAPDHPVLFRRFDHTYFTNTRALRIAGVLENTPDPRGGKYERDPATGKMTGSLIGTAGEQMEKLLPPPALAQKLIGARGVIAALNRAGLTSIHDMTRVDEISQAQSFSTFVERSYTNLAIYRELKARGELTLRVHTFMALAVWPDLAAHGIRPGGGDEFIHHGNIKDFVDGTLMFAPLANAGSFAGNFTFRFLDEATTQRQMDGADRAGFDLGIHVIGDRGLNVLLNRYEKTIAANGPRDRRFRIIHVWFATPDDLARAGRMGMIADVTPRQLLGEDTAALERNLGPERAKTAFAWRTMIERGVRVNLVSDFPGLFNKTDVSPFEPLKNIYAAVTRRDPSGVPEQGWHPEQCLTVAEAIQAYTLNPAYASHEEERKGSITAGKLADLVVLSRDILTARPEEILATEVVRTIFGGQIVFERE